MTHPTFKSPYAHIQDESDLCKVGCWVSKTEWHTLTSLVPDRGFMTYLLTSMIHSLYLDVKKANITCYDPTDDQYYSRLAEIYNRRVSPDAFAKALTDALAKAVGEAAGRNDAGGTQSVHQTPPKSPRQRTGASPADRVGRGTRGRSTEAGEGKK